MKLSQFFFLIFLFTGTSVFAQSMVDVSSSNSEPDIPIMDFDELDAYLKTQSEQLLVINFWATWCKPCVEELHFFEYAHRDYKDQDVKVILVSLDFAKAIDRQLIPYVKQNEIQSEVILLSDTKMNSWINRVSEDWSGAIPGTWYITQDATEFHEGKYADYNDIKQTILKLKK